ncbi:hypothetical protein PENPOL_c012G07814 [Penicillium polonicum]|uniref:Uncharacterized protein n=1 Tax=Penicillium polonicum TaxID=60169 RepID=A0A1V6NCM4_PENPO|nr:hypothetical protein PENPOL_c012G07814 [Penicillium polonicum]
MVKPDIVPVVVLPVLPVQGMRGVANVVRRIELFHQLHTLYLPLLEYAIYVPMPSRSMNNPVVSASGVADGNYLRRNPRANTNTSLLFPVPAYRPIPKTKPNTSPLFPVPAYRPIPKTKPNTSPIFPLPAYPPIPKTKTAGDPYNTRASDVSLPPDWDPGNTSAASRATLLKCSRESKFQRTHGGIRWSSSDQGAGGKKGRNRTVRYGGIEAVLEVFRGEAQLAIATPAQMMSTALTRQRIFAPRGPMLSLRAFGVLPQNEPHVLAIDPKYGIESFKDLR